MDQALFNAQFRDRTKKFAVDVILFCDQLPLTVASRTIIFQLIKSATSTGANYRAACRARSKAEFHAKMSIVVEEADESQFWLEVIEDTRLASGDELKRLQHEALEIVKVCSKARSTASK
jgi:four helix bundle protein